MMSLYEVLSGYGRRDVGEQLWFIATEEGPAQVRVYRFNTDGEARLAMGEYRCCRVLYSPEGIEKHSRGWNGMALATIRHVMNENYLAWH
ncbi:hypothetical protein Poli38472_009634 [Pythium oligandrum]|uniref:Uncharacterized protein n=1 Tax=Pythium oligandrum TaxID=41045 RepID=A0A8K1CFZ6_PYTOL|nr:hypothetical protein Poli38472_009634 [Pythium oligandrum]|eukprot:TMW62141.1 hypothetical protein Poli38472_009634 [Pythium oligandrum]